MANDEGITFIAQLIRHGRVQQTLELEAPDEKAAWSIANDGVDPLTGQWVAIQKKPDPQTFMALPPRDDKKSL